MAQSDVGNWCWQKPLYPETLVVVIITIRLYSATVHFKIYQWLKNTNHGKQKKVYSFNDSTNAKTLCCNLLDYFFLNLFEHCLFHRNLQDDHVSKSMCRISMFWDNCSVKIPRLNYLNKNNRLKLFDKELLLQDITKHTS